MVFSVIILFYSFNDKNNIKNLKVIMHQLIIRDLKLIIYNTIYKYK